MTKPHLSRVGVLDPRMTSIDFSPQVRGAFRDLAAAVHSSEHVSPEILGTIQEWAQGKKPSADEVVYSLPPMAKEVFDHTHATGDKKAGKAWEEIGGFLLEPDAATMQKNRSRGK